ncbi:MAG: DUF6783 domain-containing protein [Kineothrix sp.]
MRHKSPAKHGAYFTESNFQTGSGH